VKIGVKVLVAGWNCWIPVRFWSVGGGRGTTSGRRQSCGGGSSVSGGVF